MNFDEETFVEGAGSFHVDDSRQPIIRGKFGDGIRGDGFAGGGGLSVAMACVAAGYDDPFTTPPGVLDNASPDFAINHDPVALDVHAANHPLTKHYQSDIWEVDPEEVCLGRHVRFMWFSPDCTHHSQAKGGKPRSQKIRSLCWVAPRWAAKVRPDIIMLENVPAFRDYGPLHKTHSNGCTSEAKEADKCLATCHYMKPIESRKGELFRAFVRRFERLGYSVSWRILKACDYGAPTTRPRLFMQMHSDGRSARWPLPSHGPMTANAYRSSGEFINWSVLPSSIFDRSKPHADATNRRIARGIVEYVIKDPTPYLLKIEGGLIAPYLVHRSNGERVGQAPRIYRLSDPLGTIVAQGQKHALVAAFLAKHYGGNESKRGGTSLHVPTDTITTVDHHALVAAHLIRYNGQSGPRGLNTPISTIDTRDRFGLVAAFLTKFYGTSTGASLHDPSPSITAEGQHLGLVTVKIDGEDYGIGDLGMRMLLPDELKRCQGLPEWYRLDIERNGKRLSNSEQVRMIGNSVSPHPAIAAINAALEAA